MHMHRRRSDEGLKVLEEVAVKEEAEEAAEGMEVDTNPTAVLNSGVTAGVATKKDKEVLIETGLQSDKAFLLPTSQEPEATEVFKMNHKLRDPATDMYLVKDLHTSLVSVPKLADADYINITVSDKKGAIIYDGYTTTIKVSEKSCAGRI